MRIPCPHCGARDSREFSYLGEAVITLRPDPGETRALDHFNEYVYRRSNPAGLLREYWYHGAGCHAWLVVTRNTRTHEVIGAESLKERTAQLRTAGKPS